VKLMNSIATVRLFKRQGSGWYKLFETDRSA